MQHPYFLETERLGFSHWREEDINLAQSLWGNPDVVRLVSSKGYFTEKEVEKKLEFELENRKQHGIQYYPLFTLSDQSFVGCCGFKPVEETVDILEFGFYFRPEFWHRGFAQEAGKAIIQYTLETLKPKDIFAGHHPHNDASRQALARLGFKYFTDTFYIPTGLDHPYYRLLGGE